MSIAHMYLSAARKLAPNDRPSQNGLARQLKAWVSSHEPIIDALGPRERLRCYAYATAATKTGEILSIEFVGSANRYHSINIFSSGRNHILGREPHTINFGASFAMLSVLAEALGVPVTLQP